MLKDKDILKKQEATPSFTKTEIVSQKLKMFNLNKVIAWPVERPVYVVFLSFDRSQSVLPTVQVDIRHAPLRRHSVLSKSFSFPLLVEGGCSMGESDLVYIPLL